MEKILTAGEFINYKLNPQRSGRADVIEIDYSTEIMIEFAKLHVKAALENAHSNFQLPEQDIDFTLNAYPLTNIK